MKNIITIARRDLKHVTASVVAIITVLGLCIIPCLYAWFNIFSNWAPYDSEATGRIPVAVVSEDAGVDLMGVKINIGNKILTALEANDAIGWVFLNTTDEALEGVYAGDYYAALIIPEDFTQDALSFVNGQVKNPRMLYYENEKKNAIAPKITGKAKTAVQEQVNATFVQTLASYVSEAVNFAERTGHDPQDLFADLLEKAELLDQKLDDCELVLDTAAGLSGAAEKLMVATGTLISSTDGAIGTSQALVSTAQDALPDTANLAQTSADAVRQTTDQLNNAVATISEELDDAFSTLDRFNSFVDNDLSGRRSLVETMRQSSQTTADQLTRLGLTALAAPFASSAERLSALETKLDALTISDEAGFSAVQEKYDGIHADLAGVQNALADVESMLTSALEEKMDSAIASAQDAVAQVQQTLSALGGDLTGIGDLLGSYSSALSALEDGLSGSRTALQTTHETLHMVIAVLERLAGSDSLKAATNVLSGDSETLVAYLAAPVQMRTETIYPIREYGSAMAPFYTVLAQWVGALLSVVLIKAQVKPSDEIRNPKLYERFFGRYALLLLVGLSQGLIVSLGDLIYIGMQCPHPLLFVVAACLNGVVFTLINYALVFALDNIGLALGVIILVLQVAGAGGTYPVEVVPKVFQTLYPVMPFHYAMDAMRECVAGLYSNTYLNCELTLLVFGAAAIAVGLLLYRPALWLNRLIAEGKQKTGIML